MVQAAVYDAVNMIDGGREPYLPGLPSAPSSASKAAAVATAAHHVLVGLGRSPVPPLPAATIAWLNAAYAARDHRSERSGGDCRCRRRGGGCSTLERATGAIHRVSRSRYGSGIGQWRLAPPAFVNDPNAWVAQVEPFALESTSQFRTPGAAKSRHARIPRGVRRGEEPRRGRHHYPTQRTPEQTALAGSSPPTRSRCTTAPSGPSPRARGSRLSSRPGSSRC